MSSKMPLAQARQEIVALLLRHNRSMPVTQIYNRMQRLRGHVLTDTISTALRELTDEGAIVRRGTVARPTYALPQDQRIPLPRLLPTLLLETFQTVAELTRQAETHLPGIEDRVIRNELNRMIERGEVRRQGSKGYYSYALHAKETDMPPAAPEPAAQLVTAPAVSEPLRAGEAPLEPRPAAYPRPILLDRYVIAPGGWCAIDLGAKPGVELTIFLNGSVDRRIHIQRNEEPVLYVHAFEWVKSLGALPVSADERALLMEQIAEAEAREQEALRLAESYAAELETVKAELERLKTDPNALMALLSARLGAVAS
jgi:hypothetical protein